MKVDVSKNISNNFENIQVTINSPKDTKQVEELIKIITQVSIGKRQIIGMQNDKNYILKLDEIMYFYSQEKNTFCRTNEGNFKVKERLYEIENILIIFLISFTVLSIAGLIFSKASYYWSYYCMIEPILEEEIGNEIIESDRELYDYYKELYGENAPITTLSYVQGYTVGTDNILRMQQTFLIISIVIGISLGIITSLTEKSKTKEILIFIVLGLGLALINTAYIYLTRNFVGSFLITLIEDCIFPYGIYYVLIYLVIYIIKFLIGKNTAQKLNNELMKRKK